MNYEDLENKRTMVLASRYHLLSVLCLQALRLVLGQALDLIEEMVLVVERIY